MDIKKAAVGSVLEAIVSLPPRGNGGEVAALEKLMADIESGSVLKGDRKLRTNSCHEESSMKNKTNYKELEELQQEVDLLRLRVQRRDEAIRTLHRRLAVEVVQVQRGSEQSRQEARTRCREQEDDAGHVAVALREQIASLEAALQNTREELEQSRQRAGADHAKIRAQMERNEQLAFNFTEKLRSLEYEKKSSVVILAAKDRITERSQEEIVAMEEKLFSERRRADNLLADVKRLEKHREEEIMQSEKEKVAADGVREELEATKASLAIQITRTEAMFEEHAALQKQYAELWRRLDSDGGPPPATASGKSTASPPKSGNGQSTMAYLLAADTEASGSDESEDDDGSGADIKLKLMNADFKSPLHRKRLDKSKGRTGPRGSTMKPSDLILRHNSVVAEGYGEDDDQSDCSGVNLARIGLALGGRAPNHRASADGSPDAGDMRSKYTKSILGSRRVNKSAATAKGKKSKKGGGPAQPIEPPAVPPARPKSAVGTFAQSWAHSGGRQAASAAQVRPSTSPRPDGAGPAPETNDPAGREVDNFPFPDEALEGKDKFSSKKAVVAKRKKSRRYSSVPSPTAQRSPKHTALIDSARNSPIPSDSDSAAEKPVVTPTRLTGLRKTKLTVKTALLAATAPSQDVELQGRVQALQVALGHQQSQLAQEQKYFTSQIVKLKSANEALTEQVVGLEQRMSTDHKELCHERDELHRTVTFLSEQLALHSSSLGPAQSPVVVGHGLNQVSSQSSFRGNRAQSMSWDIPLAMVPEVTPPTPTDTSHQPDSESATDFDSLRATLRNSPSAAAPCVSTPTVIHLRDAGPAVTEALASSSGQGGETSAAPAGRRKGKIGSGEIYVPTFGDAPPETTDHVLEYGTTPRVATNVTVVVEDTAPSDVDAKMPENDDGSSSPPRTVNGVTAQSQDIKDQGGSFESFVSNQSVVVTDPPATATLVDAAAGEDVELPAYEDAGCQWDGDEVGGDVDDSIVENSVGGSAAGEIAEENERNDEQLLLDVCKEVLLFEESALSDLFRSLLRINEAARGSASDGRAKLEEYIDAGMLIRNAFCSSICDARNLELRNLKLVIRCLDAILIQIRTLLHRGDHDQQQQQLYGNDSTVGGNRSEHKDFFYRGSSISALSEGPVVEPDSAGASAGNDSYPMDSSLVPLRFCDPDDLDSYDIWKVYDFVASDENGAPEQIDSQGGGFHAPDRLARSHSREINIHFPVVKALVPSEPSSRRASLISNPTRLRAATVVSGSSVARARSHSSSPVADAPIFSFSKILYGEPLRVSSSRDQASSGCNAVEVRLSERATGATAGAADLRFTTTRLTPTVPTASRPAASMTSPRPKSALIHSPRQSYKLDNYGDADDNAHGESRGDRPVTAPEKRVAFNLENDSERSMPSPPREYERESDEDADSIYRRLMADFDKHVSASSGNDYFPGANINESLQSYTTPRRRHTNIYRDGIGAFRTSDETVSSGRRHMLIVLILAVIGVSNW